MVTCTFERPQTNGVRKSGLGDQENGVSRAYTFNMYAVGLPRAQRLEEADSRGIYVLILVHACKTPGRVLTE